MAGGAISTSDPRATAIGAEFLASGGNAADAAIAATLALFVLEPHHCGVGGDAFVVWYGPDDAQPMALDGSGAVPEGLAVRAERADFRRLSGSDPRSVTVPGALALLETFAAEKASRSWGELVAPAASLASEGFAVRPSLAASIGRTRSRLAADDVMAELFLPAGRPLRTGDRLRLPRLAELLGTISHFGVQEFYQGSLGERLAAQIQAKGGLVSAGDLAAHRTVPMTPISTRFRGHDIWELPLPTQGPAVLAALSELEHESESDVLDLRAAMIRGMAAVGIDIASPQTSANTSHIAVIDGDGAGVSMIASVFTEFGSCLGVDCIGGAVQNRGAGFNLVGRRPSAGKPPHTTIPAIVTEGGSLRYVLGVVGGLMQTQGQVQLLVNLLDKGMDLSAAVAAPRFRILAGGEVAAEPGNQIELFDTKATTREPGTGGFGCAQVVSLLNGDLTASADHRRGGGAMVIEP